MTQTSNTAIAVIGIDIAKNSFHVGHDARGAIVLRQGETTNDLFGMPTSCERRSTRSAPCLRPSLPGPSPQPHKSTRLRAANAAG
ncbi:MAG TPA: hypothetical protein VHV99_17300 [Paraburkholderia sp.]|nr:hypothetical protein [Paraburkholderia sp.]